MTPQRLTAFLATLVLACAAYDCSVIKVDNTIGQVRCAAAGCYPCTSSDPALAVCSNSFAECCGRSVLQNNQTSCLSMNSAKCNLCSYTPAPGDVVYRCSSQAACCDKWMDDETKCEASTSGSGCSMVDITSTPFNFVACLPNPVTSEDACNAFNTSNTCVPPSGTTRLNRGTITCNWCADIGDGTPLCTNSTCPTLDCTTATTPELCEQRISPSRKNCSWCGWMGCMRAEETAETCHVEVPYLEIAWVDEPCNKTVLDRHFVVHTKNDVSSTFVYHVSYATSASSPFTSITDAQVSVVETVGNDTLGYWTTVALSYVTTKDSIGVVWKVEMRAFDRASSMFSNWTVTTVDFSSCSLDCSQLSYGQCVRFSDACSWCGDSVGCTLKGNALSCAAAALSNQGCSNFPTTVSRLTQAISGNAWTLSVSNTALGVSVPTVLGRIPCLPLWVEGSCTALSLGVTVWDTHTVPSQLFPNVAMTVPVHFSTIGYVTTAIDLLPYHLTASQTFTLRISHTNAACNLSLLLDSTSSKRGTPSTTGLSYSSDGLTWTDLTHNVGQFAMTSTSTCGDGHFDSGDEDCDGGEWCTADCGCDFDAGMAPDTYHPGNCIFGSAELPHYAAEFTHVSAELAQQNPAEGDALSHLLDGAADAESCQKLCTATQDCRAFTFYNVTKYCVAHPFYGVPVFCDDCSSGIAARCPSRYLTKSGAPDPNEHYIIIGGYHSTIKTAFTSGKNMDQCQMACCAEKDCYAWTWYPSIDGVTGSCDVATGGSDVVITTGPVPSVSGIMYWTHVDDTYPPVEDVHCTNFSTDWCRVGECVNGREVTAEGNCECPVVRPGTDSNTPFLDVEIDGPDVVLTLNIPQTSPARGNFSAAFLMYEKNLTSTDYSESGCMITATGLFRANIAQYLVRGNGTDKKCTTEVKDGKYRVSCEVIVSYTETTGYMSDENKKRGFPDQHSEGNVPNYQDLRSVSVRLLFHLQSNTTMFVAAHLYVLDNETIWATITKSELALDETDKTKWDGKLQFVTMAPAYTHIKKTSVSFSPSSTSTMVINPVLVSVDDENAIRQLWTITYQLKAGMTLCALNPDNDFITMTFQLEKNTTHNETLRIGLGEYESLCTVTTGEKLLLDGTSDLAGTAAFDPLTQYFFPNGTIFVGVKVHLGWAQLSPDAIVASLTGIELSGDALNVAGKQVNIDPNNVDHKGKWNVQTVKCPGSVDTVGTKHDTTVYSLCYSFTLVPGSVTEGPDQVQSITNGHGFTIKTSLNVTSIYTPKPGSLTGKNFLDNDYWTHANGRKRAAIRETREALGAGTAVVALSRAIIVDAPRELDIAAEVERKLEAVQPKQASTVVVRVQATPILPMVAMLGISSTVGAGIAVLLYTVYQRRRAAVEL